MKGKVVRGAAIAVASAWAWAAFAAGPWSPPKKKVIAVGWDIGSVASPEQLLEHAGELDEKGFDGAVITLPTLKCRDGKLHNLSWEAMAGDFITEEVLGRYISAYKELTSRHRAFKDSFLGCKWSPVTVERLKWEDDAAWEKFAANMKEVASVARRGGFVGVQVDCEDYGKKRQFFRGADDPPFDEAGPIARERGRQIGRAMFGEFPDMKLMAYWFLSLEKSYARSTDAAAAMRGRGDFWLMFFNGLLDVAPAEVEFIDGDEHAYGYHEGRHDFVESNVRQITRGQALVAPENRAKYRAQMRVGFGLFLDLFTRPEGVRGGRWAKKGSRTEALRGCLEEALYASDEYVWLYGARQRWIKWRDFKPPYDYMKIGEETWEEKLPGLSKVIRETKEPKVEIDARLAEFRAAGAKNLVAAALSKPGSNWQDKKSGGKFTVLPGEGTGGGPRVVAEGVYLGCFVLDAVGAQKGDVFYAEAYVRGSGVDCMWMRWKKDGKWEYSAECVDEAFGEPDADGWRRVVARTPPAPEGMTGVTLKMDMRQKPGEKIELERVAVFKM